MKGHMQDGKFHPHSEYKKGTRKSRDQQVKTEGVKLPTIRKARITVSYDSLPSEVQNKFSQREVETLANLKDSFNASAEYIEDILHGDDIQTNLEYIERDWLGESGGRGFRNDELLSWLNKVSVALARIQDEEFEAKSTKIDIAKDKVITLIRAQEPISAEGIVDSLSNTTEDERLNNHIMVDVHLAELEEQGKIANFDGGWRIAP